MATASASNVNFEAVDFDSLASTKHFKDKGAFGEVYGPFLWNAKECAFKRIMIGQTMPKDFKKRVEDKKNIWTSLRHKNLLEIMHISLREKAVYIVMEYANGGALRHLLDNPNATLNVTNWARQIADGMLYLHDKNIVHRDLKSGNIMLMAPDLSNDREEMTLKIADFDEISENDHTTTMSMRGTGAYMAPEILKHQHFSKASDVWSYGVVVWELLTRELPHKGLATLEVMQKVLAGTMITLAIPMSVPEAYATLLHECWCPETKNRPSFKKIIDELCHIDSREENKVNYKDDPVLVKTIQTKAAETNSKGISGLAIADDELFMTSFQTKDIEVYDLKNLTLSRDWTLDSLINPYDLAYCNTNKCLYMIDVACPHADKGTIYRVDRNGKLLKHWKSRSGYGCISVTFDCNVAMAELAGGTIQEYTADGQIVRVITLSAQAGFVHLRHAIKLANDRFLICHGGEKDTLHRVCEVKISGEIQKSYDKVYVPICLNIDSSGSVIVVDRDNSRVLALSSGFAFARELIPSKREGMHRPERMVIDQKNGRMLVAHNDVLWSKCRVFVFQIL